MANTPEESIGPAPEDLSDRELLERIASLDPDKYPVVKHAERGLESFDQEESS